MYKQEAHTEQRSIIPIIKHCISLPYVTLTLIKVTVTKYTHDQIQNSDMYTEQQKISTLTYSYHIWAYLTLS